MNTKLKTKVLSGLSAQGLSALCTFITQLSTLLVLSRLLSPVDFGVLASATVMMSFAHIFVDAGVGPAIVQSKELKPSSVTIGLTFSILFGLCIYVILFLGAPAYASLFGDELVASVLRWQGLSFIILSLCLPSKALMEREMKFISISIIEMVRSVVVASACILMALNNLGIWAIVYGNLIGALVYVTAFLTSKRYALVFSYDWIEVCKMIRYGGGLTLTRFFNHLAQHADTFLVGSILGLNLLGYYERALKMIRMPALLLGRVLDRVAFPIFSRYQDNIYLKEGFFRAVSFGYLIQFPVCVAIWILAPEIISVLLGDGWDTVVEPLRIMVLCLPFRIMIRMSDSLVRAKGAVYRSALCKALFAVAVVLFCILGMNWGIAGAAWGALGALIFNYCLMSRLSNRLIHSGIGDHVVALIPGLGLAVLTGVINFFIVELMRDSLISDITTLVYLTFVNAAILFGGIIFGLNKIKAASVANTNS